MYLFYGTAGVLVLWNGFMIEITVEVRNLLVDICRVHSVVDDEGL